MTMTGKRGSAKVSNKVKSRSKKSKTESRATPPRIVAIGASAGGLDPFERFFDSMPLDTGLAFVVIQHLSPNFKSMMDELLARHSDMAIYQIEEGIEIEPNAIYLNQPRVAPTIEDGTFKLIDLSENTGLYLPINAFFESLAKDRGEDAIGLILSGTGSDGTKGCEAIREAGGIVLVQEPRTAKFDGMPNSVINRKVSDGIGEPEELANMVVRHTRGEDIRAGGAGAQGNQTPIEFIFSLLTQRYGTDFRAYKPSTIERRIRRRYEMCGLNNFQDYADLVASDREEIAALYNDLLIDVTAFFRDGEAFDVLEEKVIAQIGERMSADNQVRIWVPACSSGEEPYSIAMQMADFARENDVPLNLKILATDVHQGSLDAASAGVYSEESVKAISAERVGRYFEKRGSYYHVKPDLRKLVVFTAHSLFRDPPFTRLDLVSCRNMLIYLQEPAQAKAMALFHFGLNKNGYLFLGPSETIGKLGGEFRTIDQRWRIFQKRRDIRLHESSTILRPENGNSRAQKSAIVPPPFSSPVVMPHSSGRDGGNFVPASRRAIGEALDALLAEYAPPGFLITLNGQLVRTFGSAGDLISVGEGEFSNLLTDLVQPELRLAISAGLERIRTHISMPFQRRTKMRDDNGGLVPATLKIEALFNSGGSPEHFLVTIRKDEAEPISEVVEFIDDTEATSLLQLRVKDLERDLASTEESLQATIEELETSNEELQATNEELMASNEELQSTNEELHSVNEELYTVSAEHQRKIEELTDLTNDMDQLLKSTDIGTIFLDKELKIRRFTPAATKTFNLLSQDISRPFTHITHRFPVEDLNRLVREVQVNNQSSEREFDVDDEHFLVRVLPYHTTELGVPEIVITVLDISEIRQSNLRIEEMSRFSQSVLRDISQMIVRWRAEDGSITYLNEPYAVSLGRDIQELEGADQYEVWRSLGIYDQVSTSITDLAPGVTKPISFTVQDADGGESHYEGTIRAIASGDAGDIEFQASVYDATKDVRYRKALEALIDRSKFSADDFEERVLDLLGLGCDFFGLDVGLLCRRTDEGFMLDGLLGENPKKISTGNKSHDAANPAVLPFREDEVIQISGGAGGKFKSRKAVKTHGIKAFIGAPVYKDQSLYGSLCFYSKTAENPLEYDTNAVDFAQLLARWIGFAVERREQLANLQKSETDLRFIFDNVPARIWYKDQHNKILHLNQTAAQSMGISVEEGTGADTYDLFPDMAKKYHEDDLSVIKTGKALQGIIEEYTPLKGEHGWVSTDKIPFENPETGDRNLLVVATDVTQLKHQEIDLQTLNNELKQANDGLRQFAYVASHDLQEPLRKIRQFSEILFETYEEKFDEEGRYFLSVVSDSAVRMGTLIKDLLGYSRTAYREFEREKVDLSKVVKSILADHKELVRSKKGKISNSKLPVVTGDPMMIDQLFSNLIGNAIKYSQNGKPADIKISSKETKSGVVISVSDNGVGMKKEYLERIFEPFTRLKHHEDIAGTGIGLAICKSVCERHGWDISAKSKPGEGSVFTIKIPTNT